MSQYDHQKIYNKTLYHGKVFQKYHQMIQNRDIKERAVSFDMVSSDRSTQQINPVPRCTESFKTLAINKSSTGRKKKQMRGLITGNSGIVDHARLTSMFFADEKRNSVPSIYFRDGPENEERIRSSLK